MTMTSEQSKPIALDERDVHLFFCMFGRYEPAVALGILVMLSVWALFIILHRTVRGQRRKKDENAVETEVRAAEKMTIEEQRCQTESTVSENLREEVSKGQDNNTGESHGSLSLPGDPGLCNRAREELSWPVIGEYQSNCVPESHDRARACWDITQEHKGNLSTDLCPDQNEHVNMFHQSEHLKDQTKNEEEFHDHHDHEGTRTRNRNDHESEKPESLEELASNTVESNQHQHLCENMESRLDHFDHDFETDNKVEFLYANLNSQPDLTSEKTRLTVMEKTIKNSHFEDNQRVSSQQNDLLNSSGKSSVIQKEIHGQDSDSDCQQEETCRITEIKEMQKTVKSHQDIPSDYQHLPKPCEHLSNFDYNGLLSSLHEPLSGPSQEEAVAEMSESKMKTLDSSMTKPPEDSHEKTEINIMEATMDYNEWMNGGTVEMSKSGKIVNGTAGLEDVGMAEQCFQKSAECDLAKISITEESGTTFTLFNAIKTPAAVQPTPQTVAVSFRVHYITHSPLQLLAVTGNQQELGDWKKFVPLRKAKDGFWVNSIALPADIHVEWKFVLVENESIHRWEECNNRHFQTGSEEVIHLHKWWGSV